MSLEHSPARKCNGATADGIPAFLNQDETAELLKLIRRTLGDFASRVEALPFTSSVGECCTPALIYCSGPMMDGCAAPATAVGPRHDADRLRRHQPCGAATVAGAIAPVAARRPARRP